MRKEIRNVGRGEKVTRMMVWVKEHNSQFRPQYYSYWRRTGDTHPSALASIHSFSKELARSSYLTPWAVILKIMC